MRGIFDDLDRHPSTSSFVVGIPLARSRSRCVLCSRFPSEPRSFSDSSSGLLSFLPCSCCFLLFSLYPLSFSDSSSRFLTPSDIRRRSYGTADRQARHPSQNTQNKISNTTPNDIGPNLFLAEEANHSYSAGGYKISVVNKNVCFPPRRAHRSFPPRSTVRRPDADHCTRQFYALQRSQPRRRQNMQDIYLRNLSLKAAGGYR